MEARGLHSQKSTRCTESNEDRPSRLAYASIAIAGGATHTPYMLRRRMSLWWSEIDWDDRTQGWEKKTERGNPLKVSLPGSRANTEKPPTLNYCLGLESTQDTWL